MNGLSRKLGMKIAFAAMLLTISGCATKSPPTPPEVVAPVKLTPLPASIKSIDSKPSVVYLQKLSSFRAKVEQSLSDETPK